MLNHEQRSIRNPIRSNLSGQEKNKNSEIEISENLSLSLLLVRVRDIETCVGSKQETRHMDVLCEEYHFHASEQRQLIVLFGPSKPNNIFKF